MLERDYNLLLKPYITEEEVPYISYLRDISRDIKKVRGNRMYLPQYVYTKLYRNSLSMNYIIAKFFIHLRKVTPQLTPKEALSIASHMNSNDYTMTHLAMPRLLSCVKADHVNDTLTKQYIVDINIMSYNNLMSKQITDALQDNIHLILYSENRIIFNTKTMNLLLFDRLDARSKALIRVITADDDGKYYGQKLYFNNVYLTDRR